MWCGDLISGALIASVVQRAKEAAIKRAISEEDPQAGIRSQDLRGAIRAEYRENEIFPPTESVEDWLKLLDYDPENVVRVTPIRRRESDAEERPGRSI